MRLLDFPRWLFRHRAVEALAGLDPARTRLIIGLGNPGPEYADTRHNVGFRIVEELARRMQTAWQDRTDAVDSLVSVIRNSGDGEALVLAKPQTFMNRSGKAVKDLTEFLKLEPRRALVVYDEMDLPFGTLRLRERGSPGTHNGMRSIVGSLSSQDIPRLRVGIGMSSPGEATNHVLGEFGADERASVDELIQRAADAAMTWAELGATEAMNRYN